MSGDQAALVLLCVGLLPTMVACAAERYKTAIFVALIFAAPLILRLFVAAVAG